MHSFKKGKMLLLVSFNEHRPHGPFMTDYEIACWSLKKNMFIVYNNILDAYVVIDKTRNVMKKNNNHIGYIKFEHCEEQVNDASGFWWCEVCYAT